MIDYRTGYNIGVERKVCAYCKWYYVESNICENEKSNWFIVSEQNTCQFWEDYE